MKSTIEQELAEQGHCVFQTVGNSMEPLLHHRRSTVVIEKSDKPLKRYDVVLYHRPTGEYVLHRIVKVREKDYLICGDNRIYREPVLKDWVIGVMTGFYENESNVFCSCDSKAYVRYLSTLRRRYIICLIKSFPGCTVRMFRHLVGR